MKCIQKSPGDSGLFCISYEGGGDSELFNYLNYTLNLNCVQNVFTFKIFYKINLRKNAKKSKACKS